MIQECNFKNLKKMLGAMAPYYPIAPVAGATCYGATQTMVMS